MFTLISKNKLNGKHFIKSVTVFAVALLILMILTAPVQASMPEINVNLQINASWGGGDILSLDITDLDTGERQQVAIRLSDFIREGENVPYILLQAMDLLGERQSSVIQIENPLFDPSIVPIGATVGNSGSSIGVNDLPDNLQNIVAEATQPEPQPTLTPDGTGNVVDNIMTVNNIEFFTVSTDNGSDFFLVVDRQRTSNNVYLLNTVTEADLMALAEARGETLSSNSASASTTQPPITEEPPPTMEEILQAIQEAATQNEEPQSPPTPQQNNNSGIILLAVLLLFLGGSGFAVWKWLLPMIREMGQGNHEEVEEEIDDGDDEYENFSISGGDVELKDGETFGFDGAEDSEESEGDTDDEE